MTRIALLAALTAAVAAAPAAAAPIQLMTAPATTNELEARARNGRTGFELSLHEPVGSTPADANLNFAGAPAWTFGTFTNFAATYSAATGTLTLGADFDQDTVVEPNESTTFTYAGKAGTGYQYLELALAGNNLSQMQVRNLSLNGTPFAGPFASGSGTSSLYFDFGTPVPGTMTITGQLNLTANGNTDERPRLQLLFGGAGDPNAAPVPEPASLAALAGLTAAGLVRRFRRR